MTTTPATNESSTTDRLTRAAAVLREAHARAKANGAPDMATLFARKLAEVNGRLARSRLARRYQRIF